MRKRPLANPKLPREAKPCWALSLFFGERPLCKGEKNPVFRGATFFLFGSCQGLPFQGSKLVGHTPKSLEVGSSAQEPGNPGGATQMNLRSILSFTCISQWSYSRIFLIWLDPWVQLEKWWPLVLDSSIVLLAGGNAQMIFSFCLFLASGPSFFESQITRIRETSADFGYQRDTGETNCSCSNPTEGKFLWDYKSQGVEKNLLIKREEWKQCSLKKRIKLWLFMGWKWAEVKSLFFLFYMQSSCICRKALFLSCSLEGVLCSQREKIPLFWWWKKVEILLGEVSQL